MYDFGQSEARNAFQVQVKLNFLLTCISFIIVKFFPNGKNRSAHRRKRGMILHSVRSIKGARFPTEVSLTQSNLNSFYPTVLFSKPHFLTKKLPTHPLLTKTTSTTDHNRPRLRSYIGNDSPLTREVI